MNLHDYFNVMVDHVSQFLSHDVVQNFLIAGAAIYIMSQMGEASDKHKPPAPME